MTSGLVCVRVRMEVKDMDMVLSWIDAAEVRLSQARGCAEDGEPAGVVEALVFAQYDVRQASNEAERIKEKAKVKGSL